MQNVTDTSIQSYHSLKSEGTQKLRVAVYCLSETKAGRPVWINKIAEHFMLTGQHDLAQKSSVSARFNAIKKDGIAVDGRQYKLEFVKSDRPAKNKPLTEMYALVLDRPVEAVQTTLFQL